MEQFPIRAHYLGWEGLKWMPDRSVRIGRFSRASAWSVALITVILVPCPSGHGRAGEGQGEKLPADLRPVLTREGWERPCRAAFEGFLHAYQPCVVEVPDTIYPYRMWFFGWIADIGNTEFAGCDAIYFARGKDLDHWEVLCKDGSWDGGGQNEKWVSVLYSSEDPVKHYYDTFHSGDPSVVLKDGVFYMAYSATSKAFTDPASPEPIEPPLFSNLAIEGYPSRMIQCVMGATSTDGIHWQKTERPLLLAKEDTKYPPDPCPKRVGDFHRPSLLWDEAAGKWQLYFDYYHGGQQAANTGLAENTADFASGTFRFVHSLDEPLISDWPNPDVVKLGSRYFCFSDAPGYTAATAPAGKEVSGWQHRQLRMAQSEDGLVWEKKYFLDPDPGIDANHVPQTFVGQSEGKWWLYVFYTTQVGWRKGDKVYPFFKEGDYNWFYDQIRYMRQEIATDGRP